MILDYLDHLDHRFYVIRRFPKSGREGKQKKETDVRTEVS